MSLMKSRQPKSYRWEKGDLITATEACALLGYKSGRNLQDQKRRSALIAEFEQFECTLTVGIFIGQQQRFLRSEFDAFIQAKVEAASKKKGKNQKVLYLAA